MQRNPSFKIRMQQSNIGLYIEQRFADHLQDGPKAGLYGNLIEDVERPLIELALKHTNGNKIRAAKLLGINRNTLYKKIKSLDINEINNGKKRKTGHA